jgi:hypothetical protein
MLVFVSYNLHTLRKCIASSLNLTYIIYRSMITNFRNYTPIASYSARQVTTV